MTAAILLTFWGNTALELNLYKVTATRLPEGFDGYRIAHVSDLHNAEFGIRNEKLIQLLQKAQPDCIAITGDLIDSYHTDVDVALDFVREAVKIAPCYYVTGNHESRIPTYDTLKREMEEAGVILLDDSRTDIKIGDAVITLIGVEDPAFETDYLFGDSETVMGDKLNSLAGAGFTVLLSHRPELFHTYVEKKIDLVLCGHAHGGQVRLPFVGGLLAPNQGLFPKYDGGLYTKGNTNMVVSRGLGNSLFPFRVNNPPEVVLIQLQSKEEIS